MGGGGGEQGRDLTVFHLPDQPKYGIITEGVYFFGHRLTEFIHHSRAHKGIYVICCSQLQNKVQIA